GEHRGTDRRSRWLLLHPRDVFHVHSSHLVQNLSGLSCGAVQRKTQLRRDALHHRGGDIEPVRDALDHPPHGLLPAQLPLSGQESTAELTAEAGGCSCTPGMSPTSTAATWFRISAVCRAEPFNARPSSGGTRSITGVGISNPCVMPSTTRRTVSCLRSSRCPLRTRETIVWDRSHIRAMASWARSVCRSNKRISALASPSAAARRTWGMRQNRAGTHEQSPLPRHRPQFPQNTGAPSTRNLGAGWWHRRLWVPTPDPP